MEQNVGALDQTLRVGLGFALLLFAFLAKPPVSAILYAGFLVFAITGFTGRCMLYKPLGISTCGKEER
ncbi:MAG: DUF2892 domain-containing protein [Clostridia bacterium]